MSKKEMQPEIRRLCRELGHVETSTWVSVPYEQRLFKSADYRVAYVLEALLKHLHLRPVVTEADQIRFVDLRLLGDG